MTKRDPQIAAHLEWIGFVRPTGLVVSAPALVKAGVILNRHDSEGQRLLRECLENGAHPFQDGTQDGDALLLDFRVFAEKVLGWSFSSKGFAGTAETPIPTELEVPVPESGDVLAPDFAVRSEPLKDSLPVMTTPDGGQGRRLLTMATSGQHLRPRPGLRPKDLRRAWVGDVAPRPNGKAAKANPCNSGVVVQ